MRAMKKDPTFKKVMGTQKELKDTKKDLIGWNRQNVLSISENSYSIDCTKSGPFHKIKTRPTMNVRDFISWTLYCCISIKTVNNQNSDDLIIIPITVNLCSK